jgi:NAD-dependent dihydropyrimidine dehydrogenase PreA subunit
MYIEKKGCKKCLDCMPVCPVGAIVIKNKEVVIDYETCVECGVCYRLGICPEGAIKQVAEIPYPRIIRAIFSDPLQIHNSTGIGGRGTEEMKTNDLTNNFVRGEIGFSIELGRPGIGAYLKDLDKVVRRVTSMKVEMARDNPVVALIADAETGALRPEILGEKVLSAIVELTVPENRALEFLDEIREFLNTEIETVATVSVIDRANENGESQFLSMLKNHGEEPYPNGKVNIGLALV